MLAFGTTTAFVAVARMNAKDRTEVRILMRSDCDKLKSSDRQRTRAAESFKKYEPYIYSVNTLVLIIKT
jgi:hypothetical protein